MKILQINFKNINSLKGEHSISFEEEPLKTNSLFAITGATGSGKSTLLDVICLALFNQLPRLGKITKKEVSQNGAVLTRHQREAYAQVIYQTATGKYLSHWDIGTNNRNNLRDYNMRLKDLVTNEELDLKKSEVPTKNEALIGLNYGQFIKSILLAQGEFARFLQANDSERKQLLEQLTGTEIYRKIGALAYQKAKHINELISLDKQRISDLNEMLLPDEDIQEKENSLVAITKEKEKLSIQKLKMIQQEGWLKEKKILEKEVDELQQKSQAFEKSLGVFQQKHQEKMLLHAKTQSVADDLVEWKNNQLKQNEISSRIIQLENTLKTTLENQINSLSEASKLTHENLSVENAKDELEKFRKEVNSLQNQLNELRSSYQANFRNLEQITKSEGILLTQKDPGEIKLIIEKQQQEWATQLAKLKDSLAGIDLNHLNESNIDDYVLQAVDEKNTAEKKQHIEQKLKEFSTAIPSYSKEIEVLEKTLTSQSHRKEVLKISIENEDLKLANYMLKAKYSEDRTNLVEGEECPLCGSTSHPLANDVVVSAEKSSIENELKKLKNELSTIEKEFTSTTSKLEVNKNKLDQTQSQIDNLKIELTRLEDTSKSKNSLLVSLKANKSWDELITYLKHIKVELQTKNQLEKSLEKVASWLELTDGLKENFFKGKEILATKNSLFEGEDVDTKVNELQAKLLQNQTQERQLKEQIESYQNDNKIVSSTIENIEKHLLPEITELGFLSIQDAIDSRMKENEFQQLQKEENDLKQKLVQLKNNIEVSNKRIENLTSKLSIEDSAKFEEEKIEILKRIEELETSLSEIQRTLKNQQEYRQKIKELENRILDTREKNEKWLLLDDIIGDATGKKFNDFAQDLSLRYLLQMANKRLKQLSERYQIDIPQPKEGSDLIAVDYDMGGERRSVKTLSGGETFVVSLALALSLSDLASQNVQIQSLFIDEGFGTLDPETLDQTLDTLERLQAETNKTIGIISHVDALKERIQTQIRLHKNGQGYSSLEVVCG